MVDETIITDDKVEKTKNWMRQINSKVHALPPFLATDVEDDTHGNFKCACIYGEYFSNSSRRSLTKVDMTFTDQKEYIAFFMKLRDPEKKSYIPCMIVTYNLSYDFKYFFKAVDISTFLFAGSRIIAGSLKNKVELIDLFNHSGHSSLGEWMRYLNLEEKGIFKTDSPQNQTMTELMEHCRWDTMATWELGQFFRNVYSDLEIPFKTTTPSTAIQLFQRKFLTESWCRDPELFNQMERNAYYGGRVEVFKRGIHRVKSYDVNSMYGSVMRDNFYPRPDRAKYVRDDLHFKSFFKREEMLMIVHCRVYAPPSNVMVLPLKSIVNGDEKLIFPYGTFDGWWTSPELKAAVKYGYKIEKVYEYIYYTTNRYYFTDYVNFIYNKRITAIHPGEKQVWKLFLNALYGKFAQRDPTGGRFYYEDDVPAGALKTGDTFKYYPYEGDNLVLHVSSNKTEGSQSFPVISAFVASYARLKLLDFLKKHEDDVVYCDTDSIKYLASSPNEESSTKLGEFKFEYEKDECFLRPKLYGNANKLLEEGLGDYDFITPRNQIFAIPFGTKEEVWKIKGLMKTTDILIDLNKLEIHGAFTKPHRFKQALKRGLIPNEWAEQEKVSSMIDDKRVWSGKDSLPIDVTDQYKTL